MGMILTGTSGYSYADWRGVFYPAGLPQRSFLDFYSTRFDCVEINYTYYRMPDAGTIGAMVAKTPPGFTFTIKANRMMTHEIDDQGLAAVAAAFTRALHPMIDGEKLGCVLLQFPSSFGYNDINRRRLDRVISSLGPLPLAVEFRNSGWLKESVWSGLRDRSTALVCVDEPPLPGLIPPLDIATSGIGYVRFHGRNSKNWWSGDSASRYDYLYTDEELEEWTPRIRRIASATDRTFIFTNNHWQGKAVQNAIALKRILAQEKIC
jgi:uncharacterized protein YecE (DUF72 family)